MAGPDGHFFDGSHFGGRISASSSKWAPQSSRLSSWTRQSSSPNLLWPTGWKPRRRQNLWARTLLTRGSMMMAVTAESAKRNLAPVVASFVMWIDYLHCANGTPRQLGDQVLVVLVLRSELVGHRNAFECYVCGLIVGGRRDHLGLSVPVLEQGGVRQRRGPKDDAGVYRFRHARMNRLSNTAKVETGEEATDGCASKSASRGAAAQRRWRMRCQYSSSLPSSSRPRKKG